MATVQECLFIVSQSADPYSILLLDPTTGSSQWGFRGTELQSSKIGVADLLGEEQTHLCVALADKPVIISVPLKQGKGAGNGFCTKSILSKNANFMVSHPSGDFMFIASDSKLFTWEVRCGQMLSLVEEHVREISALRISTCGNYLASASKDGAVKVFLSANLISQNDEWSRVKPIGGHSAHTLPVNDLFISNGASPRVLSVSADHSACLYSLATQQILLRVTTDQPLTACCMDPAETRLLIASQTGRIRVVDILSEFTSGYHRMDTDAGQNGHSDDNNGTKFAHHESGIGRMCTNCDGTLLASGDQNGVYSIWDISNGQCLRSGKMSGPIISLEFFPNCALKQKSEEGEQAQNGERVHCPLISSLQKRLPGDRKMRVVKHVDGPTASVQFQAALQSHFDSLLKNVNTRGGALRIFATPASERKSVNTSKGKKRRLALVDESATEEGHAEMEEMKERMAEIERELARVIQINTEIYNYAVNLAVVEEETTN